MFLLTTLPVFSQIQNPDKNHDSQEIEIQNTIVAVSGAELEIYPTKVSKSTKWTMNFLAPLTLEQRKENLIRALCREVGADIIVDPQFVYTKRILDGGKLILTGYPATYKNFRSLNESEIDSIVINKNRPSNTIIFIND